MSRKVLTALAASLCAVASSSAWAASFNLERDHVPDQLIVKFKQGESKAAVSATLAEMGAKVRHVFRSNGAMSIEFAQKGSKALLASRAKKLADLKNVEYVEANTILRVSETLPNDADFGKLYGLHNLGQTGGRADADIDAPEAWDVTKGSRDVLVAIIDTGVDYTHPDIAPNYWKNPGESGTDAQGRDKQSNGVDDDGNGYVDDFRGWDFANNDNDPIDDHDHGTHCAGTIGGSGNDGVGVVGVNWEVSMVGVKFLTGSGSGTLEDAVESIEYVNAIGADLSSNSWGGGGFSQTMEDAIKAANQKGILFVAAAGNDGVNNDNSPHYPSSYATENVIAVAATDSNDGLAYFSCYGLESVDVGAPGVDIYSTKKTSGYTTMSGTSMATPHVSGVAALVKSAYPNATAAQIKSRIMNTVDPVDALAGKSVTGGRVNAFNALETDNVPPSAATGLEVTSAGLSSVDLAWQAAGDDGAMGRARRYEVRYASEVIDSESDWAAARVASVTATTGEGGVVRATMGGLPFNTRGFVAVKAVDNVGNVGVMSRSVAFETRGVRKLLENTADTMSGVTAEAPWGLESVSGNNVWSESPAGNYGNDLDVEAKLDAIAIDSADIMLSVDMKYDTEANYDFGIVEISTNGTTWVELDRVSGASAGFVTKSYDLKSKLQGASALHIRFRFTSDYSIVKDGFKVDNVTLFAPAE